MALCALRSTLRGVLGPLGGFASPWLSLHRLFVGRGMFLDGDPLEVGADLAVDSASAHILLRQQLNGRTYAGRAVESFPRFPTHFSMYPDTRRRSLQRVRPPLSGALRLGLGCDYSPDLRARRSLGCGRKRNGCVGKRTRFAKAE